MKSSNNYCPEISRNGLINLKKIQLLKFCNSNSFKALAKTIVGIYSSYISSIQGGSKVEKKMLIFNLREEKKIQSQISNSGSVTNHRGNFLKLLCLKKVIPNIWERFDSEIGYYIEHTCHSIYNIVSPQ